jgi:hypothetical protein
MSRKQLSNMSRKSVESQMRSCILVLGSKVQSTLVGCTYRQGAGSTRCPEPNILATPEPKLRASCCIVVQITALNVSKPSSAKRVLQVGEVKNSSARHTPNKAREKKLLRLAKGVSSLPQGWAPVCSPNQGFRLVYSRWWVEINQNKSRLLHPLRSPTRT